MFSAITGYFFSCVVSSFLTCQLLTYSPFNGDICCSLSTSELNLQFAYATLFVVCCPPVAIFNFLVSYLEIRVDARKLLLRVRRPAPAAVNSSACVRWVGEWVRVSQLQLVIHLTFMPFLVGTWQTIYLITSILAVVTNAALLTFTMDAASFSSGSGLTEKVSPRHQPRNIRFII